MQKNMTCNTDKQENDNLGYKMGTHVLKFWFLSVNTRVTTFYMAMTHLAPTQVRTHHGTLFGADTNLQYSSTTCANIVTDAIFSVLQKHGGYI